jgi:hypothetical protein
MATSERFLQTIHVSTYVVHSSLLKELLDLAIESLLLLVSTKSLSVTLELCAQIVEHGSSLL